MVYQVQQDQQTLDLIISSQEIVNNNFYPTQMLFKYLTTDSWYIKRYKEKVKFSIIGYADDNRKVWEIPEVREFINYLDILFPYWFYFLDKKNDGLKIIMLCCSGPVESLNKPHNLDQDIFMPFLITHYRALNVMCQKADMNYYETQSLSRSTTKQLSQKLSEI